MFDIPIIRRRNACAALLCMCITALLPLSCGDGGGGVCAPNSHPTDEGCACDDGYLGGSTGCEADRRFASALFSDADLLFAPMKGSRNARVTIIEFCEFQCPFCMRLAPLLDDMIAEFPGDVQVYWLHNPLAAHINARPAVFAAISAFAQNRFWEYHDRLFATREDWSWIPEDDIDQYFADLAQSMDFDMAQWRADFANDEAIYILQQDRELADDLNARTTPVVFINDTRIEQAWDADVLRAAVQQALDDNP